MWEWRIFYPQNSPNFSINNVYLETELLKNPTEHRFDFYYNFFNECYGLKERGPINGTQFIPALELKILREKQDNQYEYWDKILKFHIKKAVDPAYGIEKQKILEILNKKSKSNDTKKDKYLKEIIFLLKRKFPPRLCIEKTRQQLSFKVDSHNKIINLNQDSWDLIWLEKTRLTYLNQEWMTMGLESNDLRSLKRFVEQYLDIREGFIAGYPEFIKNIH